MTISTTSITKSGLGNGTAHSFVYDFPIFNDADLTVIVRSAAGTETTKTLNTHYVVTGAGASSGGTVLFKFNTGTSSDAHHSSTDQRPASGETVVIRSELSNTQTLDLVANDPFPASSFETALDRLVRMVQQHDEELNRSIKLSRTNTMTSTEFTNSATDRASKILAFDSTGELSVTTELGTFKGNWAASTTYALRDIVKDTSTANIFIAVTAHTSSGSQPLTTNTDSAKWSLLVDAASATTSQNAAAASATSAGNSETASEAARDLALSYRNTAETHKNDAETAKTAAETALDNFDDRFLGAFGSDPSADNDGNALLTSALYWNNSDGLKVYSGSAWELVKPSSSEQTNINTLAGISSDVTTLSNALSSTTTFTVTVASVSGSNVFVIDGSNNPTLTLDRGNTYIFDQSHSSNSGHPFAFKNGSSAYSTGVTVTNTAGSSGAKVTIIVDANAPASGLLYYCTVHGNAMGNTIATVSNNFATVASSIGSVNSVAGQISPTNNISTVAGAASNVGTVAGSISNVNTVAGADSNISALNASGVIANIGTVAGIASNVTSVAGVASNVTTVAGIASNVTSVAGVASNVTTVASNLTNVNNFADRYRIASSDPTSSLDSGDLAYNTSSNQLKFYNGSAWVGIAPGLSAVSADSGPQLGGNLNVGSSSIISSSNANINITPDGSGKVVIDGLSHPTADGSAGQFLKTDGSGVLSFQTVASDLSGDSSPQLAGDLDVNSNDILMGTQSLKFGSSKWEIVLDNTNNTLDFKYNGTVVFSLASNGAAISANNVTAFGTP